MSVRRPGCSIEQGVEGVIAPKPRSQRQLRDAPDEPNAKADTRGEIRDVARVVLRLDAKTNRAPQPIAIPQTGFRGALACGP